MATASYDVTSDKRAAVSVDEFPGLRQTAASLAYWLIQLFDEMSESDPAYAVVRDIIKECRLYKHATSRSLKNRWENLRESAWIIQQQHSAHAEAARLAASAMSCILTGLGPDKFSAADLATDACNLVLKTLSSSKRERLIKRQLHRHFLHHIGGGK